MNAVYMLLAYNVFHQNTRIHLYHHQWRKMTDINSIAIPAGARVMMRRRNLYTFSDCWGKSGIN